MSVRSMVWATASFRGLKKDALKQRTEHYLRTMTMDELYQEVLYEILHMVGAEEIEDCDEDTIFTYLRETFKFEQCRHEELLERARAKEAPNIVANVEVMEARGLKPKDANGLSDPFCTLYLSSSVGHRFNTSVKQATLSPVWEEHLALPVQDTSEDVLFIEVWDFDPAETVQDKVMKIGEVKGVRGLRKLMKEIAITVSTGKHDNELVGIAKLPLKNVPPGGLTVWLNLERKNKTKKQGEVKLRLSFSSEKNQQVAIQEHRHLVRLMLLHELEANKVAPFDWDGAFPAPARVVLSQHAAQCGLKPSDTAFSEFLEYVHVHQSHPLSFKLFSRLMAQLFPRVQYVAASQEEVKTYWDAVKRFLPSCYSAVRKIRKLTPSNKNSMEQLISLLSILARVERMPPPENVDLFPRTMYGWLSRETDEPNCDVIATLTDAVIQGANDWFTHISENNHLEDSTIQSRLKHQLRLVQLVRADLQKAVEFVDKHFRQHLRFPYALTLFNVYESKVAELSEPLAREACLALKPLPMVDLDYQTTESPEEEDPLTVGTTLFELYIVLQRLAVLGQGLSTSSEDASKYSISNYHTWFHRGVAHWLDIALYKAMRRVRKAVDLDTLEPVSPNARHSSSAVDTLSIFYQIRTFWKELTWPDVEGSYTFVFKLIDDICRCSVYYADEMCNRVEGLGEVRNAFEAKFEVTQEWCLAINNISYVREYIEQFVTELGVEEILTALEEFRSEAAARHCRETLRLVVDNARETVHNKIHDLLETVAHKMVPAMSRFLQEGAELLHQDSNSLDRLMKYLEENLLTLNSQLYPDNFSRILTLIWNELTTVICSLFESGLENRRPPSFFASLNETIDVLVGFFKQDSTDSSVDNYSLSCDALKRVRHQLLIHGMDTPSLIHQFMLERAEESKSLSDTPYGLITIRAHFVENLLRIQIMNARNLKPMDSNGSCDPFVKIYLLPEEKFSNISKPKTKTHKKDMFPLFDETFTLTLTNEQNSIQNGLILFVIKDQDFLGMRSEFIGESFLLFSDIPRTEMTTGLEELPQVHLKLNRPSNFDTEAFRALDRRQGDKLARDFIKRQKAKIHS